MRIPLRQYMALLGITIAAFIFNTSEFIPIALLIDISESFSMTEAAAGQMITIYAWVVALLSLPLMLLTCRMELKRLLLLMVALFGIGQLVSGLASSYDMLLGARIIVACAHSIFWAMGSPRAAQVDAHLAQSNPQWAEWLLQYGALPRHPSQLYQFALEGLMLFVLVWWFSRKQRPVGQTAMLFLAGYGVFRFIAEYARQPDDYLGLLTFGLSMGQWLSLPMVLLGVAGFVYFGKKGKDVQ